MMQVFYILLSNMNPQIRHYIMKVWQKEESARLHPNFFIYTGAYPLVSV